MREQKIIVTWYDDSTRADHVSLSNIVDFGQVNLTIQNDMAKVLTCARVSNVSLSNIVDFGQVKLEKWSWIISKVYCN